jgi:hypothetical protein
MRRSVFEVVRQIKIGGVAIAPNKHARWIFGNCRRPKYRLAPPKISAYPTKHIRMTDMTFATGSHVMSGRTFPSQRVLQVEIA